MFLCNKLHVGKLIRPHGTCTNVTDLSSLNKVVKSFHGLFGWNSGVVPVDLEEVDIVCSETLEGGIDGFENSST